MKGKRFRKGRNGLGTHTLAWGFFLEKSQARPKSEILTWPCSSRRMLAGCEGKPRELLGQEASLGLYWRELQVSGTRPQVGHATLLP